MYYSNLAKKYISIDLGTKQIYTFDKIDGTFAPNSKGVLIKANKFLAAEIKDNFNLDVAEFGIEITDETIAFPISDFW